MDLKDIAGTRKNWLWLTILLLFILPLPSPEFSVDYCFGLEMAICPWYFVLGKITFIPLGVKYLKYVLGSMDRYGTVVIASGEGFHLLELLFFPVLYFNLIYIFQSIILHLNIKYKLNYNLFLRNLVISFVIFCSLCLFARYLTYNINPSNSRLVVKRVCDISDDSLGCKSCQKITKDELAMIYQLGASTEFISNKSISEFSTKYEQSYGYTNFQKCSFCSSYKQYLYYIDEEDVDKFNDQWEGYFNYYCK